VPLVACSATSDEGDHDVGGVAIEVLSSPVVDGCSAWVGVAGGDLDVSERDAGVESGGFQRLLWGGDSGVPWLFTR